MFGKFFLPGPTEVRPEILAAQTRPMIGHRGKAMEELVASLGPGLQYVFRTARPVYISSSSATGLMDGAFSERFHRIAVACGLDADVLEVPLGEGHSPDVLEHALSRADYDAVTV